MTGLTLALFVALTTGAAGAAPEASAADVQKAKELFTAGQKHYKQGEFTDAIEKFEAAYAVRPHPVVMFNIAKCYEQLNETAKAMRSYREYLRLSPDAKDRDAVTDILANLERRLKERGVQQLVIFADPPNARIEVDGKELSLSPASVELTAGPHKLTVRSPGYETVERTFTFSISRASEMTINLKAGATPPIPSAGDAPRQGDLKVAKVPPPETTTPPTAMTPEVTRPPVAPAPTKKSRVLTWVAGGLAVGAAGAGVGLGVAANGAANSLTSTQHNQLEAQNLYNQAKGLSTGANVCYGVAAGLAVTAVVLFFVEK